MTATRADIQNWLNELYNPGSGYHTKADKKYTHMIVAVDTWDYENYPVFVEEGEDVREVEAKHNGPNMSRVDEVYSVNHGYAEQMAERRA